MKYSEVNSNDIPTDLLLEASPSEEVILSYLPGARCFAASDNESIRACCVVKLDHPTLAEIHNISVYPQYQARGIGSQLLRYVLAILANEGVSRVELGTGTFGYQLTYYQRLGFRVGSVEKDYFLRTYPEPVFESGIQHKDRLKLYKEM